MPQEACFLCNMTVKTFRSIKYLMPISEKPIEIVLQHLANCIKTKLVFQSEASVCLTCFQKLCDYDEMMLNLLKTQKSLACLLKTALHRMNETAPEYAIEQVVREVKEEPDMREEFLMEDSFNAGTGDMTAKDVADADEMIEECFDDTAGDYDFDIKEEDYSEEEEEPESDCWASFAHECVQCGKSFKYEYQLTKHIDKEHKTTNFNCKICGTVCKDDEYLELHMNIHEGKDSFINLEVNSNQFIIIIILFCTSTGKSENECRFCDKTFARPVNTIRHMRKHWDKKKFQCEKCGERFSLDNMLYNHRMRHEAEENPIICSTCNQTFRSRKTYNHHMLIHQENRPRYACALCAKSFTERYTLKIHMKTHHDKVYEMRPSKKPCIKNEMIEQMVEQNLVEEMITNEEFEYEDKNDLSEHLQSDTEVIIK